MQRRWRTAIAALAVLGLGTAACGGDDGASDQGSATGPVTVYSGRAETLVKPLFEQFSAETGIKIEARYGDSGVLSAQILTEGTKSPADVFFSQDAGALGALTKAKLANALPKSITEPVPAAYRAKDATWVGTSARVRVIIYNPKLAPNPPKSIDELLAPEWKGKIAYPPTNASWQSFVTGLRVLRGEGEAEKWLKAFAAQQPKAYEGNGPIRDAVDKGDIALGLINHYYLFEKIAKDGADKVTAKNQYLPNDPGGLINVAGAAVLKSSKNKAAAEKLVAYLVGPKGQAYFAEKTVEYPLVAGTKASALLPPFSDLKPPAIDLSNLDSLAQTQEMLSKAGLLTK